MKILYISGTRADYGLMKEVLFAIKKHPKLQLEIAATAMHLMKDFGYTVNEIKKDGFKPHKIIAIYQKYEIDSRVDFNSEFLSKFLKKVKEIKPDIIFVQGDRPEMLAGAIVAMYSGIPVAHTHGGDVALGPGSNNVDEMTRHAITKLSHIHFAATQASAQRIIKMGEEERRIYVVGAPGLDCILNQELISKEKIVKKYRLDLLKPIFIVIQHPTIEKDAPIQMKETMEAIKEIYGQAIVVYPNADPGGEEMVKIIEKYRKEPHIKIYKNIEHKDFLSLMKIADVMIGNSSAGIIEAPSFKLPVVNIGTRQTGRERASNVIDTGYSKVEIKKAVNKALNNKRFRYKLKDLKSPYANGTASKKIVKILARIKINAQLLNKRISY